MPAGFGAYFGGCEERDLRAGRVALGPGEGAHDDEAPRRRAGGPLRQLSALSVTSCVQAPSGSALMTGSEPPARSVSTVRW